jgi:hypothetical protein
MVDIENSCDNIDVCEPNLNSSNCTLQNVSDSDSPIHINNGVSGTESLSHPNGEKSENNGEDTLKQRGGFEQESQESLSDYERGSESGHQVQYDSGESPCTSGRTKQKSEKIVQRSKRKTLARRRRQGKDGAKGRDNISRDEKVQWRTEGSELIGQRVRRGINEGDLETGYAKGLIAGWLPPHESDFVCSRSGRPAALWRLIFDEVVEYDEDPIRQAFIIRFDVVLAHLSTPLFSTSKT